jgi:hypothetical protein
MRLLAIVIGGKIGSINLPCKVIFVDYRLDATTRRTVDLGHCSSGPSSIDLAEIRVTITQPRLKVAPPALVIKSAQRGRDEGPIRGRTSKITTKRTGEIYVPSFKMFASAVGGGGDDLITSLSGFGRPPENQDAERISDGLFRRASLGVRRPLSSTLAQPSDTRAGDIRRNTRFVTGFSSSGSRSAVCYRPEPPLTAASGTRQNVF